MSENKVRFFRSKVDGGVTTGDYLEGNPNYTEVQVVPVDAIVVNGVLPKVAVRNGYVSVDTTSSGRYAASTEGDPEVLVEQGLAKLALAKHLREHPPVDEAQVAAVRDALLSSDDGDVNYIEGDDAWKLARRMVQRFGVRMGDA